MTVINSGEMMNKSMSEERARVDSVHEQVKCSECGEGRNDQSDTGRVHEIQHLSDR